MDSSESDSLDEDGYSKKVARRRQELEDMVANSRNHTGALSTATEYGEYEKIGAETYQLTLTSLADQRQRVSIMMSNIADEVRLK